MQPMLSVNRSSDGKQIMKRVNGKNRNSKNRNMNSNNNNDNTSSTKRSVILPLGDYLSNLDAMISREDAKLVSGLTSPLQFKSPMINDQQQNIVERIVHQAMKTNAVIAAATEKRRLDDRGSQHEEDNDDAIWWEVSLYRIVFTLY